MKNFIRAICLFTLFGLTFSPIFSIQRTNHDSISITPEIKKAGDEILVRFMTPKYIKEVEIRFESDRNNKISRITDVSPFNPKKQSQPLPDQDIWYPVIDQVLEPGMEGVVIFKDNPVGEYVFGGPFYTIAQPLEKQIVISDNRLEYWENSLFVKPSSGNIVNNFYLRKKFPVSVGRFEHNFKLLSEDWSGKICIYGIVEDGYTILFQSEIESGNSEYKHNNDLKDYYGKGLEKERLIESLKATIDFTLRCQNTNPESPTYGGPFLFYDLDAKLYRTSYWMWGWGPSVKLLLDAAKSTGLSDFYDADSLIQIADEIGKASLRFQVLDQADPGYGLAVASWGRSVKAYDMCVTSTDILFLAGWSWIPLFMTSGDSSYLEATRLLSNSTDILMDKYEIVPSIYYSDSDVWSNHVLDESGFGTEGLAAAYKATRDTFYLNIAVRFMDVHIDKLMLDDGLWARHWFRKEQTRDTCEYKTRGLGWAMEGLLATYEITRDKKYLDYAKRMAEHLVKWQQKEGYWTFNFNIPEGKDGVLEISEKGTALWSLLFYRLYNSTKDERYLTVARKALEWCLENQYTGEDPEAYGSIVGLSWVSGVGYRRWFNLSCVYTSAFFGLAVLEELKLREN